MTARSYPTWIITQQPNEVPFRKGPFHDNKLVEAFLREAYRLYPEIICIVVDGPLDNTWWPQHGYEWLDINGDGRKRHPRKDRPSSPSPQPNVSGVWRPINTVPKDGRKIEVRFPSEKVMTVFANAEARQTFQMAYIGWRDIAEPEATAPAPQVHVVPVRPLEWMPYHSDGATVYEGQNQKRRFVASARFPWGGTVCVMEKDGWFTLDGSCFGAFVDEQGAKDAAQAEFERWIRAALATTEGKDNG